MEASNTLFQVFRSLVQQLPSLLTMLGCMVVAIVLWKRHPRISLTVIISMVLLIVHAFVFAIVYVVVPTMVLRSSGSAQMQSVYTVISLFFNLGLAVALGVLLAAVFMQRKPAQ
jgi:glucan phosphoethanolaminetransferase (alkaline phosphatase superfamily)